MTNNTYLFSQPSYCSPNTPVSKIARAFPSICVYIPTLWEVIKGGYKAYFHKYTAESWIQSSQHVLNALENVGCCINVTGLEHIHNTKEPCVIIGNHMSMLETFVLPSIIQPCKPVTFVVKESLLKYPFFGKLLSSRNPIVIGRRNPREDFTTVLKNGVTLLNKGTSIIVFPQSTRSHNFDTSQFNSIGIKLARRAGVPIIPLALKSDAWGNGSILKDFGPIQPQKPIHFAFSTPMYIDSDGKREHQIITSFIHEQIMLWNTH